MSSREISRQQLQRIRDFVLGAASDGTLVAGAKLPTEREFSKRFKLPRNAVRRALAHDYLYVHGGAERTLAEAHAIALWGATRPRDLADLQSALRAMGRE